MSGGEISTRSQCNSAIYCHISGITLELSARVTNTTVGNTQR